MRSLPVAPSWVLQKTSKASVPIHLTLTTVTGSSGRTPVTKAPRWRSSSLANATTPPEPFLGVWESSHYATACCGQKANAGVLSSLNAALGIAFAARSGRNLRTDRTLLQLAHRLY